MFNWLWGLFSLDMGIDLGTANTLVYVRGKGIVIDEPSVVAINTKTNQVLAIGDEAKNMVGKTPANIVATRPLVDGVVSDFEITEQMLKYFISKVHKEAAAILPRPRVVIGIPSGVTEVERRAVEDAARNAGARKTYLIEEPMAAAIGARLPIQDAAGCMVVDIGGGTTEVAVISLGGIVAARSLRIAGDELTDDIVQYARDEFNLQIGERTAENIKMTAGSAYPQGESQKVPMRGRDLVTGLPKEILVGDEQMRRATSKSIRTIIEAVKLTIEETPPELVADIMERGIILTGGGALMKGLGQLLARQTKMPVIVASDPLRSVAQGTGLVLEDLDRLKTILVPSENNRGPR